MKTAQQKMQNFPHKICCDKFHQIQQNGYLVFSFRSFDAKATAAFDISAYEYETLSKNTAEETDTSCQRA